MVMSMRKKPLIRPGAAPYRCHKRVVSLDGLLFSFVIMKLWKAEEESRPLQQRGVEKTCTTETSKYQIARATFEALVAPFVSAPLRC